MVLGLGLEAVADWQKARFKAANPSRFANWAVRAWCAARTISVKCCSGSGTFVSGIAAYQSIGNWLIAGAGLVCIELIMLGSARRLEIKQGERYGERPGLSRLCGANPDPVPGVPLYSLRTLKVYLG